MKYSESFKTWKSLKGAKEEMQVKVVENLPNKILVELSYTLNACPKQ